MKEGGVRQCLFSVFCLFAAVRVVGAQGYVVHLCKLLHEAACVRNDLLVGWPGQGRGAATAGAAARYEEERVLLLAMAAAGAG